MEHLAPLIQDLAIILITAAVTSLLFKKLKQPVILGYMVAGLLVGPHNQLFPTVTDVASIKVWAEMGVIFMLFSLGIEFSFRRLAQMGSTILLAGFFQIIAMILMGLLVGHYILGWKFLPSLFLGAMLSISSTTIIFKAFDELKLKSKRFAQLVFGILIVEDLAAILLMVLLTTLGLSREFEGVELLGTIGKLGFYLVLWFVIGSFLIPWFLKEIKNLLEEEIALIISLALCLLMVLAATQAGFSPALGAFFMGAILSETDEKDKIHKLLYPVSTLFSAIFFVSIGMLINPETLIANPWTVALITGIVIVGKIYYTTTGALLAGQDVRTSISTGISMAQIGEFSFIFATLGITMKVTDDSLYSIIVAVSGITTFTTPYLIKNRESLTNVIEKMMPANLQKFLQQYLHFSNLLRAIPEWQLLVKTYLLKIIVNVVMVTAIFLLSSRLLLPLLKIQSDTMQIAQIVSLLITFLVAGPFLWGLTFSQTRNPILIEMIQSEFSPRTQRLFTLFRMLLALFLLTTLLSQYMGYQFVVIASLLLFAGLFYAFFPLMALFYNGIEKRFLKQLNPPSRNGTKSFIHTLAPWDAHLSEYDIHPEAECIGKPLHQLQWRESFGVTIAMIQRGQRHITAPGRNEMIMPHDRVSIIGTDEQLADFENYLNTFYIPVEEQIHNPTNYILDQYLVTERSQFLNRTIKDSGIREKTSGLVVGVERHGRRILNPDSAFEIKTGDLLWIVGDSQQLKSLKKQSESLAD